MTLHILMAPAWYPTKWDPINGISFRNQVIATHKSGYKVGVIAPQFYTLRNFGKAKFERGYENYDDEGVPTYRCYDWAWLPKIPYGNSTLWVSAGLRLFKEYVSKHGKPDLIHASCVLMAGILAAEIKKKYGIPFVLAEYGNSFDLDHEVFPRWLYRMIGHAARQADALIVPSHGTAQFMQQHFGVLIEKAVCVPIVVDQWFFDTELSDLRPKDGQFCFLNIANMNVNKGQEDLIRAFALQFQGNENIRLRVIGDGPRREALKALCCELGIDKQVHFLGRVDNDCLTREMAACNAFVLPSRYETLGTVMAEAFACGKPVVATRCWGPETVVREDCGVLVPVKDPKSMGEAMAKMVANIESYDPKKIREYCQTFFTRGAVLERTREAYQLVLGSNRQTL